MKKSSAIITILSGSIFMSFVGLLLRLLEEANGFQVLFYRSFGIALVILIFICFRRKIGPITCLRTLDWNDFWIGVNLSIAFSMYVFAMFNSSVASTLFILSITPFIAAFLGWVFLNERLSIGTLISIAIASLGVVIMIFDGLELERTLGNIFALISGFSFSIAILLARLGRKDDVLGGTFLGGVFCILVGFIACFYDGFSFQISFYDFVLLIFMGSFTIGIGIMLVTWGTPFVPTSEVCLLVLLESVLGSIWPWVFLSEQMTFMEIIGSCLILFSIIIFSLMNKRSG